MTPNDTALAAFVRDFGDILMSFFTLRIYQSPTAQLILYIASVLFICSISLSLFFPSFLRYWISFLFAWIMLAPYQGKPVLYYLVNNLSVGVSTQLQKLTYDLFQNFGVQKSLAPNYIYNSIYRAASTTIKDPSIKKDIFFLIENCIPHGKNNQGNTISAADIFSGKPSKGSSTGGFSFPFSPKFLEDLANRTFRRGNNTDNCKSLLVNTNLRLRDHLVDKVKPNRKANYQGANNGDSKQEVKAWKGEENQERLINTMALNLAHANSIQRLILEDVFGKKVNYRNETDKNISPSVELSKNLLGNSLLSPTKVTLNLLNSPTALGRYFNVDGFFSSATGLQELNERILNLPYYVSYVQIFLKLAVIILLFTALFGSWRFVTLWASCWFLTLNVPWILNLSRVISNLILIHALKLKDHVNSIPSNTNFLTIGVDFTVANKMLEDTSRMMNVFINCEKALWGSLFFIIPAAGWFASGKINNVSAMAMGQMGGLMSRKLSEKTIQGSGKMAKGLTSFALKQGTALKMKSATLMKSSALKPFSGGKN